MRLHAHAPMAPTLCMPRHAIKPHQAGLMQELQCRCHVHQELMRARLEHSVSIRAEQLRGGAAAPADWRLGRCVECVALVEAPLGERAPQVALAELRGAEGR